MKTLYVPTITVLCGLLLGGSALAVNGANSPLDPCPESRSGQIQQQPQSSYQGTSQESPGIVGERFYENPATSDDPINKLGVPGQQSPDSMQAPEGTLQSPGGLQPSQ